MRCPLAQLFLAVVALTAGRTPSTAATPPSFERDLTPLLQKYCYDCHGDGHHKSGLALDDFKTVADIHAARKQWKAVLHHVTRHEMPPEDGAVFPTDTERGMIAEFLERELFQLDPAHPDPGRVTLRRLNRAEYNNALRDLVGIDFKPAANFPPDDSGYGFDNNGDVLSLPPSLLEKYLAAAGKALDQALVTDPIQSRVLRIPASLTEIGFNALGDRGDGWVQLISLEEDDVAVELPVAAGDYLVRFQAFSTKTGGALVGQGSEKPIDFKGEDPGPTRIALLLNDTFIRDFVIAPDLAQPDIYEARLGVPAGKQRFRAAMLRQRGGENELTMLNGRLGKQQPGIVSVKWLEVEGPLPAATRRAPAATLATTGLSRLGADGARVLTAPGAVTTSFEAPHAGEFSLRAQAYAQQAGTEPTRMEFRLDGQPLQTFDVLAPATMQPLPKQRVFSLALLVPQPRVYECRTKLAPGRHTFSAALVSGFADPANPNPNLRERSLFIQNLEVADLSSPVLTPPIPAPLAELFARHGANSAATRNSATARSLLADFARRAWRRPLEPAELGRLAHLYEVAREQGDTFEGGVKLALNAALVSPHFLFQNEGAERRAVVLGDAPPPSHLSPPSSTGSAVPLDDFALASRLAFFLWSSVPDNELLEIAARGQLHAEFDAQVRRLLASPNARALTDNFAGQWLQIRSLETMQPDRKAFPSFDAALRSAMQQETEHFFEHVRREDCSLFDFLRADYTFVNARLAKFYGLTSPNVTGDDFQKVSLAGTPRRGVLTHASVLTLTSNPTRTSPVKRGKWVLDNILGTPPPPPPPNVPDLEDRERKLTGTLRQQMEQHRANPTCASCHARMDPIGFALENFDGIGAWREQDGGAPIDSAGKLAGGDAFTGTADLAELLAKKRGDDFRRCLAEKMLTYALGRGVEYYDRPAVERIISDLRANDDKFSTLIHAVAKSFPFQNRRAHRTEFGPLSAAPVVPAPAPARPAAR
ncbi:MAG: DUF1592 domain-containing protein [Opitutus sp.]|nr:DUF1592 domain-containing protein [Opitutus sp.]